MECEEPAGFEAGERVRGTGKLGEWDRPGVGAVGGVKTLAVY